MQFTSASQTDAGLVRSGNEDAMGSDNARGLFALSDGMGGHQGGEVASAIVIETILGTHNGFYTEQSVRAAINETNGIVQAKAEADPELKGMGATLDLLQPPSPEQRSSAGGRWHHRVGQLCSFRCYHRHRRWASTAPAIGTATGRRRTYGGPGGGGK